MEDTDRDFFMSAKDAVSYGLIDAIIDHPTNVAVSASESRCILLIVSSLICLKLVQRS